MTTILVVYLLNIIIFYSLMLLLSCSLSFSLSLLYIGQLVKFHINFLYAL